MYSVVLAAVLTTGAGTPAWGFGCHGCHGGCYGCHGCYGGCYGCYGCYGGCYGCYGCSGCYGCYGGCYGCYGGCYGCYGCYGGCNGCYGCYGCAGCYGCYGAVVVVPKVTPPPKEKKKKEKTDLDSETSTIVVHLPAEAKLFVDNVACPLTSDERSFRTPKLQPGRQYYYMLKAEVTRDGEPVVETKKIYVAAGKKVTVDFGDMATVSTTKR
jgi:uncharacterized protein (TIGR03000 family)